MRGILKGMAILTLIFTAVAATLVAYGYVHRFPNITSGTIQVFDAKEQPEVLTRWKEEALTNRFQGLVLPDAEIKEDAQFVQYTVRLHNRGMLPVEWLSLEAPLQKGDLMLLPAAGPNVLRPRESGDLTLIVLRAPVSISTDRNLVLSGYVLGEKITVELPAGSSMPRWREERNP